MNCLNCGAAMDLVDGRDYFHCEYCQSYCFPPGTGDDGVRVVGGATQLNCPLCTSSLVEARIEGESVEFCPRCRGFLASNPVFATIVREGRAKRPFGDSDHQFNPADLNRHVDCPQCKKKMDTHPYYGGGRVAVCTCDECELIWLDAGELTIIEQHNPQPRASAAASALCSPTMEAAEGPSPFFDW